MLPVWLLVLALCMGLASGCGKKTIIATPTTPAGPTTPAQPEPVQPARAGVLAEARAAWNQGRTIRAEILYGRLLKRDDLSASERAESWKRYALSALGNNHLHLALDALPGWLAAQPGAESTREYQDALLGVVRRIGRTEKTETLLRSLFDDNAKPWRLRTEAGLILAGYQWNQGDMADAVDTLSRLYGQAESEAYKKGLERRLLDELERMDDRTLAALSVLAPDTGVPAFPLTMVRLEEARRLARDDEADWPRAWRMLRELMSGAVADRSLVTSVLMPLEQAKGRPEQSLILALPLTGPYGGVGWKILRGAGVAQWKLAERGMDITVRVVNTEADNWIDDLDTVTAEAGATSTPILGGPLRVAPFRELRAHGELARRPVFAFMPGLGDTAEGRAAWRFFSSPRDEVRALLDLAVWDQGISSYGVLYPEEPYGRRMSELFTGECEEMGGMVNATASYPPSDPKPWGRIVGNMIGVNKPEKEGEDPLPPETGFQAVFIPDSWSKALQLVPQFFFHQEERLLILGPTLWGQNTEGIDALNAQNFKMAVYPGAWWGDSDSQSVHALRLALEAEGLGEPDFWVALGYDFIRFASLMGSVPAEWSPGMINDRLNMAQDMPWAMAPLGWDDEGLAHQELFLFNTGSDGPSLLNKELLTFRMERAREYHERRVEQMLAKREAEAARAAGLVPEGQEGQSAGADGVQPAAPQEPEDEFKLESAKPGQ